MASEKFLAKDRKVRRNLPASAYPSQTPVWERDIAAEKMACGHLEVPGTPPAAIDTLLFDDPSAPPLPPPSPPTVHPASDPIADLLKLSSNAPTFPPETRKPSVGDLEEEEDIFSTAVADHTGTVHPDVIPPVVVNDPFHSPNAMPPTTSLLQPDIFDAELEQQLASFNISGGVSIPEVVNLKKPAQPEVDDDEEDDDEDDWSDEE